MLSSSTLVEVDARTEDDGDDLRRVYAAARVVGAENGDLYISLTDNCCDAAAEHQSSLSLAMLQARMARLYVAAMEGCVDVRVTVIPPLPRSRRPQPPAVYLCPTRVGFPPPGADDEIAPAISSWTLPPIVREAEAPLLSVHGSVCLGGTFDRLHAGHKLMLGVAALVCAETLYVGLTDASMLRSKRHREMVQPFDVRRDAVAACVRALSPRLRCAVSPLLDPWGPSVHIAEIGAIVVSRETTRGAEQINEKRAAAGFAPLAVVVIAYVPPPRALLLASADVKLSSTALRNKEANSSQK